MSKAPRLLYRGRNPGMVLGRMPGGKGTAAAQELSMQDVALMAQGGSTQVGGVANVLGITALTGDVTATGPGSAAATLAASGVTAGAYTNASVTVDAKGRVTVASSGVAGSTTLAGDTDVSLAALADNDLLRYQTSDSKWHNVAKNTYSALITVLGTIATGVWQGTKIALAYGGTNADLSATGGTSKFLRQNSVGANVDVVRPDFSDLASTLSTHLVAGSNVTLSGTDPVTINASAPGTGTVTSVAMTVPTGLAVAGSPITTNGTLAVTWSGLIPLAQGGTHKDLSASGGTSYVLMQESAGASVTVRQLVYTDISGTPGDWDDPFIGAWSSGGWGTGPWGGLYYGIIPPSTAGQLWLSRGEAMTPEWSLIGDNGSRITYNGSTFIGSTSTPTDTTSTTTVHKMAGYAISFTPLASGQVRFVGTGIFSNNTANDGMQFQLRYGTGTAPIAGAAVTGTTVGNLASAHSTVNFGDLVFACIGDAALTVGTTYWVDAEINTLVGSTANFIGVTVTLRELP